LNKYSVTIVGLGNIGMLYDYHNSGNVFLSHVKSLIYHDGFYISNVIDKDRSKLELAKSKYGDKIESFHTSINTINHLTDVVVLSSFPNVNQSLFQKLKDNTKIKLFVLEKPFWKNKWDINDYLKYSNKCYINYYRKTIPAIQNIKKLISNGRYGNVIGLHIWYSKGLLNNGSHIIDLVNYLFPEGYDPSSIQVFDEVQDYTETDSSIAFLIKYKSHGKKFPVIFQVADERHFSLIELDLIFEKKRLRVTDFGNKIDIYSVKPDPNFKDYLNLVRTDSINTNLNNYGMYTYDSIYEIVNDEVKNYSNLYCEFNINTLISMVKKKKAIKWKN